MGEKTLKIANTSLIIVLVIGMVVGYGLNLAIPSPKIGRLREEIENKNNQITSMQSTIDLFEENITNLMVSLTDLTELYDTRATELQELTADYDALEEDYIALEAQSASLESVIEEVTEENQELLDEYEKLFRKYTEIRGQPWTYFEAHGLRVNLTTTTTMYDTNKPIIGSISIYYEDNEPFKGTIYLTLWSEYYSNGKSSDEFSVYGKINYSFNYPFVQGPGIYYLRVKEIFDDDGDKVVNPYEINEYSIKITMG